MKKPKSARKPTTTITVDLEVKNAIGTRGRAGESYNDVLRKQFDLDKPAGITTEASRVQRA
ncbi:MAG: hypothetical protein ABI361_02145 [Nitrososphaera sp.]